jgi:hypothetical protein
MNFAFSIPSVISHTPSGTLHYDRLGKFVLLPLGLSLDELLAVLGEVFVLVEAVAAERGGRLGSYRLLGGSGLLGTRGRLLLGRSVVDVGVRGRILALGPGLRSCRSRAAT